MDRSLRETLLRSGAIINGESRLPLHFGEPELELQAALQGCALADRSNLARLESGGPDLLGLLNRLGTAALQILPPDSGRQTVLTSPKGRIVERLYVHALADGELLLVGGPGRGDAICAHVAKYTFREQFEIADGTAVTFQLALVGPSAAEALLASGFERPQPFGSTLARFEGQPVQVLGEDGLTGNGFSVVGPVDLAGSVWHALNLATAKVGGRAAGEQALEAWRVMRGIPASGHELTEDANPLEAGLREAVAFDKGCYVGQEVVARLDTYDKISRGLVGLRLSGDVKQAGLRLYFQERDVGVVTSVVVPPGQDDPIGLAYLKRRVSEPGIELEVGSPDSESKARMVSLPFAPRSTSQSNCST